MSIRTGDLAHFNRTVDNMQTVQSRLRYSNLQISTGKSVHRYVEMGADAGVLVRTEAALTQTRTFKDQNELLVKRLNLMDGAMAEMKDIASSLQTKLIARRSDASGDMTQLGLDAAGMMQQLAGKLNMQIDGRFVFAGSRTDAPPVDAALVTEDPNNRDYYRGDDVPLTERIDTSVEADYGVRANEQAFAELFAALQTAIDADAADDDVGLQEAADMAGRALDGLITRRGRLDTVMARVEGVMESQTGTVLYLQETVSHLTDTDVPTTMARIAQDRVSLEGSFAMMSQLNRLSLTEYLR